MERICAQRNKSIALLTTFVFPTLALAQTSGFVATLGTDTVHVERFVRRGNRLEGTSVIHAPTTRVVTYSMAFNADGSPARYEVETRSGDGVPIRTNAMAGSMDICPR